MSPKIRNILEKVANTARTIYGDPVVPNYHTPLETYDRDAKPGVFTKHPLLGTTVGGAIGGAIGYGADRLLGVRSPSYKTASGIGAGLGATIALGNFYDKNLDWKHGIQNKYSPEEIKYVAQKFKEDPYAPLQTSSHDKAVGALLAGGVGGVIADSYNLGISSKNIDLMKETLMADLHGRKDHADAIEARLNRNRALQKGIGYAGLAARAAGVAGAAYHILNNREDSGKNKYLKFRQQMAEDLGHS